MLIVVVMVMVMVIMMVTGADIVDDSYDHGVFPGEHLHIFTFSSITNNHPYSL